MDVRGRCHTSLMATPFHSAEDVRVALVRRFVRNGVEREQWLADLVLPIVRAVLEERDREIERLRVALGDTATHS